MEKSDFFLTIIEAYENNLKDISFKIPTHSITCVNGMSGSGKSSLVNGIIAKESFRRKKLYENNKSDYFKLVRPNYKSIYNLPNVLIVNQKPLSHLENSTVATASGLNDILRAAFLKEGIIECECGSIVDNEISYETIQKTIKQNFKSKSLIFFVDYVGGQSFNKNHLTHYMRDNGFTHFQLDNKKKKYTTKDIEHLRDGEKYRIRFVAPNLHDLEQRKIPTDRLSMYIEDDLQLDFSYQVFCHSCLKEYQKKSLSLFTTSRLSDRSGCCTSCCGIGKTTFIDYDNLIISHNSLESNFLRIPIEDEQYKILGIYKSSFKKILTKHGFKNTTPYFSLSNAAKNDIRDLIKEKLISRRSNRDVENLISDETCHNCHGTGFNYKSRAVKIDGKNISEIYSLTAGEAATVFRDPKSSLVLQALEDLSLDHLSLGRTTDTLSGGELQRIKLVRAISCGLNDSLIVIDEPSSGLSVDDVEKLFRLLSKLRDEGNTVLIVDHSEHIISKSDYSLSLGPGSGPNGGSIVEYINQNNTNEYFISEDVDKNKCERKNIVLFPVNHNNVVNQRVIIPLNAITAVVGNSGSGKSSLIHGVIKCIEEKSALENHNVELISEIVLLNQKHIRANKRSSVLTFLGLSDELRKTFSQSTSAKALALDSSYFTSNGANGACVHCCGEGEISEVICSSCGGSKFKNIVLSVTVEDFNIVEILNMPILQLVSLELPLLIIKACKILIDLGLGHLGLGRVLTEVSGGEAQRLKLVKFLIENEKSISSPNQHLIIILDEPCRGLSTKDSKLILGVFRTLTKDNNTVILVEHNPFVISQVDHIIQMGPGVGNLGGKITFNGSPNEFANDIRHDTSKSPEIIHQISSSDTFISDEDERFSIIRDYSEKFEILTSSEVVNFSNKNDLISFAIQSSDDGIFYFNPFCNDFYIADMVPNSIIKERLTEVIKFGVENIIISGRCFSLKIAYKYINNNNIWNVLIPSRDLDLAYSLGAGWLAIKKDNKFIHISNRLVDISSKVIGSRAITSKTFNTFYNGCNTCLSIGSLSFYDDFINDPSSPLTDVQFYNEGIQAYFKKHLFFKIKEAASFFKSEGLIDLSKPFNSLDTHENLAAFFGLPNFSFLKKNGRQDALSDRITWKGLISIFDLHAEKIEKETGIRIGQNRQLLKCPTCLGSRFKKEVHYYKLNGKSIFEK